MILILSMRIVIIIREEIYTIVYCVTVVIIIISIIIGDILVECVSSEIGGK